METNAVEIVLEQEHPFKVRKDPETGKRKPGCEVCGEGKLKPQHLGAPPSLNDGGSGMDRMAFQSLKKAWMAKILDALDASPLPLDLEGVSVEALCGFPCLTRRDGGNYRWMVEKALGDALEDGGYIERDTFYPVDRYSFDGIQAVHTPGRSWIRLLIMPRPARDRLEVDVAMLMPDVAPPPPPGQETLDLA